MKLLTQQEVADMLRVSYNTITNMRKDGKLLYFRTDERGRVLYFENDVLEFVKSNTKGERNHKGECKFSAAPKKKEWSVSL